MGTHPIFESDFDCLTEMTLLRRPVAREITKRKSPISDEKDHGDDLSEITDNSSLALNTIQAMNEKRLENLKQTYEMENKCSRISFAENDNPLNTNTPANVQNPNVYDTPTQVEESDFPIEDHVVDGRRVPDSEESEDEDNVDFNQESGTL